jgi:uncharacterized RDD family membrane protein YckC
MGKRSRRQRPAKQATAQTNPPYCSPPGLLHRLGALFYDSLLLFGVLFFATLALLPWHGAAFGPHTLLYQVYLLAVTFLFFGWFWTQGGQTLGMRAWKIKLYSADGGAVTWQQAGLRFFAALFSIGLLGLGFLAALADPEKRCWHDRIANTRLQRRP